MLLRIALVLFSVFVAYRSYFWPGFWKNFYNITVNAFFDTAVCIGVIFILYQLVEKRWGLHQKPILYALIWVFGISTGVMCLFGLHWLGYTMVGAMNENFSATFQKVGFQVFDSFTLVMVGTTSGFSVLKFREAYESKSHLALLRREQEQAELRFLKSQMNPHFIFNSLNTIYFSIDKGHPARDIVSTFSDLLRFQLYECSYDLISLKQEVAFLKQYLLLYEIRMSENMELKVDLPDKVPSYQIAPLLIIPFVENALKHASSMKGQKRKVFIELHIVGPKLIFNAVNTLNIHDKNPPNKKGIGVKNAQRRMDLLFGNSYDLKINRTNKHYEVDLKIPLQ